MEEMKGNTSFIDDIIKQQGVCTNNTPRSSISDTKRGSNNKKKANRKNK